MKSWLNTLLHKHMGNGAVGNITKKADEAWDEVKAKREKNRKKMEEIEDTDSRIVDLRNQVQGETA